MIGIAVSQFSNSAYPSQPSTSKSLSIDNFLLPPKIYECCPDQNSLGTLCVPVQWRITYLWPCILHDIVTWTPTGTKLRRSRDPTILTISLHEGKSLRETTTRNFIWDSTIHSSWMRTAFWCYTATVSGPSLKGSCGTPMRTISHKTFLFLTSQNDRCEMPNIFPPL